MTIDNYVDYTKTCKICNTQYSSLGSHIVKSHNITQEWYYKEYILKSHDKILCNNENCENEVHLCNNSLRRGMNKYCSKSCHFSTEMTVRWKNDDEFRNKMSIVQSELHNQV